MNEGNDPDANYRRCAYCQDFRITCSQGCLLAPYFPHHMKPAFKNVRDVFGLGTICKNLRPLDYHHRNIFMKNLINEANLRTVNPVRGCFGHVMKCVTDVQRLDRKLEIQAAEINCLRQNLAVYEAVIFPPGPIYQPWGNIVQASHPQQIGSGAQRPYQGQIGYLGQEHGQASTSHQQHHRRTRPRLGQERGQASTSHQQHHRMTGPRLGQESGQPGQASTSLQQLHRRTNQGLGQEEQYRNPGRVANPGQESGEASSIHQRLVDEDNYQEFGYVIGPQVFPQGQMNQQGGNMVQRNLQAPTNQQQPSQQPNQEQGNMNRFQ
ncbi:glutenin, high molecular weight subunit PW212-like [Argentina anserina]|uniref:glutenin, high molecular weight subunit PW212-like n=1 Tax=Argentina anserina TaxID=57926 RepID=UPI0021765CF1|nr:glutenin, high molecular weight subunit PW212-like [Potentilla anserina]